VSMICGSDGILAKPTNDNGKIANGSNLRNLLFCHLAVLVSISQQSHTRQGCCLFACVTRCGQLEVSYSIVTVTLALHLIKHFVRVA
jgi:hypothetical protein